MEKIKNYLEDKKEDLENKINNISLDFINDNDIKDSGYICDAITEYADNRVDIYNSDLLEWAKHNYELVEDSIDEFGVATDSNGKADFIRTIMQAQFLENENLLNQDFEEIIKILAINYLLENLEDIKADFEKVEDVVENLEIEIDNNNRLDDILDHLNEQLFDIEEE